MSEFIVGDYIRTKDLYVMREIINRLIDATCMYSKTQVEVLDTLNVKKSEDVEANQEIPDVVRSAINDVAVAIGTDTPISLDSDSGRFYKALYNFIGEIAGNSYADISEISCKKWCIHAACSQDVRCCDNLVAGDEAGLSTEERRLIESKIKVSKQVTDKFMNDVISMYNSCADEFIEKLLSWLQAHEIDKSVKKDELTDEQR